MNAYWAIRGLAFTLGLACLSVFPLASLLLPELYFDSGPVPGLRERVLVLLPLLCYGALLVTPFRFGVATSWFQVRFSLLVLAAAWVVMASLDGLLGFLQGDRSALMVPMGLYLMASAAGAPAALLARRRQLKPNSPVQRTR